MSYTVERPPRERRAAKEFQATFNVPDGVSYAAGFDIAVKAYRALQERYDQLEAATSTPLFEAPAEKNVIRDGDTVTLHFPDGSSRTWHHVTVKRHRDGSLTIAEADNG